MAAVAPKKIRLSVALDVGSIEAVYYISSLSGVEEGTKWVIDLKH